MRAFRLLHVRGGVSSSIRMPKMKIVSSPRPWRCFHNLVGRSVWSRVFSTSVEVFPLQMSKRKLSHSLLHVRGGVSTCARCQRQDDKSSPRPWRCFRRRTHQHRPDRVFSTSVEVFLARWMRPGTSLCLLHVRGGVSRFSKASCANRVSSPRPWRCFCPRSPDPPRQKVFSTSVEVFPAATVTESTGCGLLHVRGGV